MAIPLFGSSVALFNRLGRVGKVATLSANCQANVVTVLTDIMGRYTGLDEFLTGQLAINREGLTRGVAAGLLGQLTDMARATLTEMVRQDQPARVSAPVTELVRQMRASVDSVKACVVTCSAVADGANVGDNVAVVTAVRGDGRTLEHVVAEVGRLVVTADSRTGGMTAGAEQVRYTGVANAAGVWDWDFPQGSGGNATANSVDAKTDTNSSIRNGGWDAWTGAVPDRWTTTGAFTKEVALVFGTAAAAVRVAAAASATLTQSFNSAAQSPTVLNPLSSLSFAVRVRGSAALTGGTLVVSLVDGAGATLLDDIAVSQSVSFALNGTGTAWVAKTGTLRLPRVIPTTGYAIRVAVNAPVGGAAILDHMAASPPVALYTGGPSVSVYGGATPANVTDGWTVTATNDRGGATYGLTWQSVWGRLFGFDSLLPSSGAPTVLDTLITS